MVKQGASQLQRARRAFRAAAQEQFEIEVLNEFLPKALSDDEIDSLIQSAITDSGRDD